jgi:hypothetical protein
LPSHKATARKPGADNGGVDRGGGEGGGGGGGGGGDGGRLVKVGFGRNQAEAEMLQGLLLESGIPSVLKRSGGFDAPEFLSAGPHDVYVRSDVAQTARDLLAETLHDGEGEELRELEEQRRMARGETGVVSPGRLAFRFAIAVLAAIALVLLAYQLS